MIAADEARAKLRVWQEQEWDLLVEWWAARCEHEEARAALAELRFRRDRAVSRLLGGMTARQQSWVQSHLSFANRPRDLAGRRLVLMWLQRHEDLEACQALWAPRIEAADLRLRGSEDRLRQLAGLVLATWGRSGCREMTGMTWQRVAAWVRGQPVLPE
ncbi:MAG: hypothetical protein J2P57_22295 [Acidimicrobiaceae bacterium]|nr:hypothetical protein [Acidimicrobiaceae bacterium]